GMSSGRAFASWWHRGAAGGKGGCSLPPGCHTREGGAEQWNFEPRAPGLPGDQSCIIAIAALAREQGVRETGAVGEQFILQVHPIGSRVNALGLPVAEVL